MNKIRRPGAAISGRRDPPAEAEPPLMALIPAGTAPGGGEQALSARGRRWQRENRAAIDCYNEWIAEHGLPPEDFRGF